MAASLEQISAVTALSSVGAPVGAGGWGVNARANHVPLANRMTELTYAERREQYAERGGGAGGVLRTITRPTLNLLLLLHACV